MSPTSSSKVRPLTAAETECIQAKLRTRRFDPETNLLYPSKALFFKSPSKLTTLILRVFSTLGLVELTVHPKDNTILETTNLTIFNTLLVRLGPMNEKRLNQLLIVTQVSME